MIASAIAWFNDEFRVEPVGHGVSVEDRMAPGRSDPKWDASEYPVDSAKRAVAIRAAINEEDSRLRKKFWFVNNDDVVGTALFALSFLALLKGAHAYSLGHIGSVTAFFIAALASSVIHEIEHDVIHDLYWKGCIWMQDIFFWGIWIAKLGANPWWRKEVHLWHHLHSGTDWDLEERLIGLGMEWGPKRVLLTLTPPLGSLLAAADLKKAEPSFKLFQMFFRSLPGATVQTLIQIASVLNALGYLEGTWSTAARVGLVCWVLPNMVRQSALQLVSSYEHYYSDIPARDVFFQNQVLTDPITWPAQMFCMGFGATHILHHYVVRQPFYWRTAIFPGMIPVMKEQGVRFNDFGIVGRANHWGSGPAEKAAKKME